MICGNGFGFVLMGITKNWNGKMVSQKVRVFFLGGWYYEYEEKVFGDNECCEEDKK